MLAFTDVMLGDGGTLHCARCRRSGVETFRSVADVTADIQQVAESWGSEPGPNVSLGGAEPFHHPNLPQIVGGAVRAGVERIRLDSDCSALRQAGTATGVLHAGVRHLRFSLLGSSAELHDALSGRPEGFAGVREGAKAFCEAAATDKLSVQVSARVPVCRHNLQDLPAVVTFAAAAGATAVHLIVEDEALDLRVASPWLEAACDSGIVNATWVDVEGLPYGYASGWELHLASVYRQISGAKASQCEGCALNDVCGGAVPDAASGIVSLFHPPEDAERMAECIGRGFTPPERKNA